MTDHLIVGPTKCTSLASLYQLAKLRLSDSGLLQPWIFSDCTLTLRDHNDVAREREEGGYAIVFHL